MEENTDSSQVQQPTFDRSSSIERVASLPEDQAAMTIEFLRARLLSERSISKAARQRTQHLAKKVSELEQRVESEIQLRKKLQEARWEILSKHKGELMEDFGHLFVEDFERVTIDDLGGMASKRGSDAQLEHEKIKYDEASIKGQMDAFEGNVSVNQGVFDDDDDGDDDDGDDDDDIDKLTREKGILAWASRRGTKRLEDKERGQGTGWFNRSLSQKSISTASPDRESPHKRWVGKSVRQIRKKETRNQDAEPEGDGEAKHDHTKDGLPSDEERDTEVERVIKRQTEFIEQFEAEESAQKAWEEKFQERNRLNNDRGKEQDAPRDMRHKEEENISIVTENPDIKEGADITHDGAKLAKVDECLSKKLVEDVVGEPLEGGHGDNTEMLMVPLLVVHRLISENNNDKARGEAALVASTEVSEVRLPGVMDDAECKHIVEGAGIDMPSETQTHDSAPDSSKDQNAPLHPDLIPRTSSDLQDEAPHSIQTPLADPQEETLNNQLDFDAARMPSLHDSGHLSSGFKFYASSSEGFHIPTGGASYQRQDISSLYTDNREQAQNLSKESGEKQYRNQDYTQESVDISSLYTDNAGAMKADNHEDMARRTKFDSPSASAHGKSSHHGLMNSSWEEIFKRRIRAQESGQVEISKYLNNGSPHPHFHMDKQQYAHSLNTLSSMRAASHDHSVPLGYGVYQEKGRNRGHRKSVDGGLDRVMEVLRALQIAKHEIESSNEHGIDHFGYPPQFIANARGDFFSSSPARGVEPFMHAMEDRHAAAAAGYVRSPSRQPTNMQHAWRRAETMPGQNTWPSHRSRVNPSYASQQR